MKIACVLAKGFEDSEFRGPFEKFTAAGHKVTVIGAQAGAKLEGKKGQETATVDKAIDQVRPDEFDALFIPGGHSPDQLRADERFVQFVKAFANKPIFAICHGPQLLMAAGLIQGRTMTAWKTVQQDLKLAGVNVVDKEVVVDRNLVTSRKPEDVEAFSREALRLMTNGAGERAGAARH